MALDVFRVDKSLDERLEDYSTLFFSDSKSLVASEIADIWSFTIEFMVELSGWQAIWKVSRVICAKYKLKFPTMLFVEVLEVFPKVMSALVRILAVQDDIEFHDNQYVSLTELIPTIQQKNDKLFVKHTAECLDQLRYFYKYLWMPWDEEWSAARLVQRINMLKDMESGVLSRREAEYIKSLFDKTRELIDRAESDVVCSDEDEQNEESSKSLAIQMDIKSQLLEIQREIETLENPDTRKLSLLLKLQDTTNRNAQEVFIVQSGGTIDELLHFFSMAKLFIEPDAHISSSVTLSQAFDNATERDIVLLSPGIYTTGGFEKSLKDGIVRGLPTCILSCGLQNEAVLDWSGSAVTLHNIILREDQVRTLCIVRTGLMKLYNCVLEASSKGTDGILVLNGAIVELHNCTFSDLRGAVVSEPDATVTLDNCTFRKCNFGIQAFDTSRVLVTDCDLTKCLMYGVQVRRTELNSDTQNENGTLDVLSRFDTFNILNSSGNAVILTEEIYSPESSDSSDCETLNCSLNSTIVLS